MIWGLTLEPGKHYTRITGDEIQLSMASLETRDEFGSDPHPPYTQVILTTKRSEYLLCTLAHGTAFQQNLDLRLRPSETVTFSVQGKSVVYLMGYSASDTEISDSIEINFELDDREDIISEFADSEAAPSPITLSAPAPTTLPDENPSQCVREVTPVITEDGDDETEGTKDSPSSPMKQEEAEQSEEETEELLTLESVPIKEELADSPEMSCHDNSSSNQQPQDGQEIPQRHLPVCQIEPPITHSHAEVSHVPYIVSQQSDRLSQDGNLQDCEGSVQDDITSPGYPGNTSDSNTHGQYIMKSQDHISQRYECSGDESMEIVQVGFTASEYPDQQSEAVWPVSTSDHDSQRPLQQRDSGIPITSHDTAGPHQASSTMDAQFFSGVDDNGRELGKNVGTSQCMVTHHTTPFIDQRPMDSFKDMYKCDICDSYFKTRRDWFQHKGVTHKNVDCSGWPCKYCHMVMRTQTLLRRHECHQKKDRPFPCAVCSKSFSRRWNLLRHHNLCHGRRAPQRLEPFT